MEQKFADLQTAFDFLSVLLNGDQTKTNMGRGIMLIQVVVLKVINNERLNKLCRCAKNLNYGFIRNYVGQIFPLPIDLSSLTFVL